MKVYGDISFSGDGVTAQKVRFGLYPEFPEVPKIGNLVFKDKKLYIYTEINTLPIWFQVTSEVLYFSEVVTEPDTTWTINHNMDEGEILIQCYSDAGKYVIPEDIDSSVKGVSVITFLSPMAGRVFIVQRTANADRITIFATDESGNYITDAFGNLIVVG